MMVYGQQQISGAIAGMGGSGESRSRQKQLADSQTFRERRDESVGFERTMEPGPEPQRPWPWQQPDEEDTYL